MQITYIRQMCNRVLWQTTENVLSNKSDSDAIKSAQAVNPHCVPLKCTKSGEVPFKANIFELHTCFESTCSAFGKQKYVPIQSVNIVPLTT